MKLIRQSLALELRPDLVHTLGNNQTRARFPLRQKISHRTTDGSRHPDSAAIPVHQCELAGHAGEPFLVSGGEGCQRLLPGTDGKRVPAVELVFNSIAVANISRCPRAS